jgi:parallel beta-helix repeat protein
LTRKRASARSVLVLLLAVVFAAALSSGAGADIDQGAENEGDQWIAKQYTELLGRTPTVSEWQTAESTVLGVKLLIANQKTVDKGIVATTEFANLGYSNTEKAVVLFRAILDRDPQSTPEVQNIANIIGSSGINAAIDELYGGATAAEAQEVNGEASQAGPYYWGNSYYHGAGKNTNPNSTNAYSHVSSGHFAGGTAQDLQNALDATPSNGTLWLDEGAVVTASGPSTGHAAAIEITGNKTLATWGVNNRNAYARMARIIRTGSFTYPLIKLNGGTINYVWVDGNRTQFMQTPAIYTNWYDWNNVYSGGTGCGGSGTSYPSADERDCMKNISIVGNSSSVTNSRVQDPLGSTNMKTEPAVSGVTISNNLITSYATSHYYGEVSCGSSRGPATCPGLWAGGVSADGSNVTISNNQIVDATDVSVVLFGRVNNTVSGNTAIQPGNSAFGAFVVDPLNLVGPPLDYTGSAIRDNTFWSGWYAHYTVALSAGSRAWFGGSGRIADHVTITNNVVPTGVKIRTGVGVAVDAATNSTVTGNNLNRTVSVFSQSWIGYAQGNGTKPCTTIVSGDQPAVIIRDNADSGTGGTVSDPSGAPLKNEALHTTYCADVGGTTNKESVDVY